MSFISCEVSKAVGGEIIYDFKLLSKHFFILLGSKVFKVSMSTFSFCFAHFTAHAARINNGNSDVINSVPIAVEVSRHWNKEILYSDGRCLTK